MPHPASNEIALSDAIASDSKALMRKRALDELGSIFDNIVDEVLSSGKAADHIALGQFLAKIGGLDQQAHDPYSGLRTIHVSIGSNMGVVQHVEDVTPKPAPPMQTPAAQARGVLDFAHPSASVVEALKRANPFEVLTQLAGAEVLSEL